jgi:hypothetical protein
MSTYKFFLEDDESLVDFLTSDATDNFEGVLGLDFFKDMDLSISFKRFEISLS